MKGAAMTVNWVIVSHGRICEWAYCMSSSLVIIVHAQLPPRSGSTITIHDLTTWSRSTIHDPRSTIHDPRSTIHDPRSTIHDPRSTIHDPPSHGRHHLYIYCRLKMFLLMNESWTIPYLCCYRPRVLGELPSSTGHFFLSFSLSHTFIHLFYFTSETLLFQSIPSLFIYHHRHRHHHCCGKSAGQWSTLQWRKGSGALWGLMLKYLWKTWQRRKSKFINTTTVHDVLWYSEFLFPVVTHFEPLQII